MSAPSESSPEAIIIGENPVLRKGCPMTGIRLTPWDPATQSWADRRPRTVDAAPGERENAAVCESSAPGQENHKRRQGRHGGGVPSGWQSEEPRAGPAAINNAG